MRPLRRTRHGLHSSAHPQGARTSLYHQVYDPKSQQEDDARNLKTGKGLTLTQKKARDAAIKEGRLTSPKNPVLSQVQPDHPDQPKIDILFTLKFDPYSGKWRTLIRKTQVAPEGGVATTKKFWSRPMTLYELEKLAKREADEKILQAYRAKTTAPRSVGISGLDLSRCMELGIFKKAPATSLNLTEGRARAAELIKARHALATRQKEEELENLFEELGLNKPYQPKA